MPRSVKPEAGRRTSSARLAASPSALAALPDDELLEAVARRSFGFFWEGAHPASGLALDRCTTRARSADDRVAVGGSGLGVMALLVAVERGWVTRAAALDRLGQMLDLLARSPCYHGALPHFMNGRTAATMHFGRKDDGGDLVETAFLCMGLLCARQYFQADTAQERLVRDRITSIWEDVEWDWYTQGAGEALYWHWSPNNGWALNHPIHGWNECLITYVLAASSPRYAIDPAVYHRGFASGADFLNGKSYYGIELPLGEPYGGPLFFAHHSFCALDPRGLKDRYADYWELNSRHVQIHRAHAIANPNRYAGYGASCWGFTASDDPAGYALHSPVHDNGTVTPSAALSSLPYAPAPVMSVLRHFLSVLGKRIWGRYGFVDAFCEQQDWYADTYLAIDQGPIVIMIENHRSGLLWELFMSVPEVQAGLRRLGFSSPWLGAPNGG